MFNIPTTQFWNNTKLARILTLYEGLVDSGNYSIKVFPVSKNSRRQVDVIFRLMSKNEWLHHWNSVQPEGSKVAIDDAQQTSESRNINITSFDMAVMDAIDTLWQNHRYEFNARQLLLTMSGEPDLTISSERSRDIDASIEKLRNLYLIIDCTEELKRRKEEPKVIDGYLLNIEKEGKKYRMVNQERSPLYRYASVTEQIISVQSSLLTKPVFDKSRKLSNDELAISKLQTTQTVILLKREILRHIILLANENNTYDFSVYYYMHLNKDGVENGLFKRAGIERGTMKDNVWNNKYRVLDETVETILKMYRSKPRPFDDVNLPLFYKYELVYEVAGKKSSSSKDYKDIHNAVGFRILLNKNQQ